MAATIKQATEAERQELARIVKRWRKDGGLSSKLAAEMLGLEPRALERVEQGHGSNIPTRMFVLSILAFRSTPDRDAFSDRASEEPGGAAQGP